MTRFHFRVYTKGDPDGFNIWVDAQTESEARHMAEYEYRYAERIDLVRTAKK